MNDQIIKKYTKDISKNIDQAQYSLNEQLENLIYISNKFKLYDASDFIKKILERK